MSGPLDPQGNAIETFTASVYCYDPETQLFTGLFNIRIAEGSGLPPHSTLEVPPDVSTSQTARFTGMGWEVLNDFRGQTQYNTETGQASVVEAVGDLDAQYTLIAPQHPYDKWNGSTWVEDADAKQQYEHEQINAKKNALILEARTITSDWKTQLDLGIITDEDKAKLTAWMKYVQAVNAVDPDGDGTFPDKPE